MGPAVELPFDAVCANIKVRFDERSRNALVCPKRSYKACSVLKLQKPSWTNDSMDWVEDTLGIFFPI
jgi:hypothetical protein